MDLRAAGRHDVYPPPPCRCGGEDGSTQWICAQQAITTWEIFIFPSNATFNWTAGKGGRWGVGKRVHMMLISPHPVAATNCYPFTCTAGNALASVQERAGVYSQVWGRMKPNTWGPSIHTFALSHFPARPPLTGRSAPLAVSAGLRLLPPGQMGVSARGVEVTDLNLNVWSIA